MTSTLYCSLTRNGCEERHNVTKRPYAQASRMASEHRGCDRQSAIAHTTSLSSSMCTSVRFCRCSRGHHPEKLVIPFDMETTPGSEWERRVHSHSHHGDFGFHLRHRYS